MSGKLEKKRGVPEGVDPEEMESCVRQLKGRKDVDSPYAVCSASLQGETKKAEGGSMTVDEAVDKILHDKWEVQDVIDKVPKDKRDDVLAKLRELKQKKDYPHKSVHGYDPDKKMRKSLDWTEMLDKSQDCLVKHANNGQWALEPLKKADECHVDDPDHEAQEQKKAKKIQRLAQDILDLHESNKDK